MDEPTDFVLSDKAQVLVLRNRLREVHDTLTHLDAATFDLREYARTVEGTPDADEWAVVLELLEEVRDVYGLRSADR